MEPDKTLEQVEATKQAEGIEPAASTEATVAEASAEAAVPCATAADNIDAPVEAGAPPQIDPVVPTEAVTVGEPQQPSGAE